MVTFVFALIITCSRIIKSVKTERGTIHWVSMKFVFRLYCFLELCGGFKDFFYCNQSARAHYRSLGRKNSLKQGINTCHETQFLRIFQYTCILGFEKEIDKIWILLVHTNSVANCPKAKYMFNFFFTILFYNRSVSEILLFELLESSSNCMF